MLELEAEPSDFEVEPDNWPTVLAWCLMTTQWRMGPSGCHGLDYTAVDVVMRRRGIEDVDGLVFAGLQVMEGAALAAMHEARR